MCFPKVEWCLWRDSFDDQSVTLGTVSTLDIGFGPQKRYTRQVTFHIDTLLNLADKTIYSRLTQDRSCKVPVPVEFSLKLCEE